MGFVTHFHCDHVGGMGAWREEFGFPVVGHRDCIEPMRAGDLTVTGARMPYVEMDEPFVSCPIDEVVDWERTFRVGERTFLAVAAPGHSVSGLHLLSDELVFVGDNLFEDGTIGWMDVHWGSNPEDYVETLERLRAHRGRLALPAHGEPYTLDDEVIDHGISIASFYLPPGHGLGCPRASSRYRQG
jgi:glyoxylase-like metal-dependent hydrolase (beta-lactamase superfamily II)